MNSADILERLEAFTVLLELNDANPFKIRAYQNGIRALEGQAESVKELIESGRLGEIKGIGKGLAAHIDALYHDGPDPEYEELKAKTPAGLLEMLRIPGLGSKKVKAIYASLGISSLGELEYACQENRLAGMKGFGAKSQANVLKGIEFLKQRQGQFLYPLAEARAQELIAALQSTSGISQLELVGDLRRHCEVLKEIQLLASCTQDQVDSILNSFTQLPMVAELLTRDANRSRVKLASGLEAELWLCAADAFITQRLLLTGSAGHVAELQAWAEAKGYHLNADGLFQGDKPVICADEAELYRHLGLNWVPPELRENTGELVAASQGALPGLLQEQDLQGVFHAHTTWSDGDCSLAEMVQRCRELGYRYLGVSEHSRSAVYAHGLEVERVRAQWQEIDTLNASLSDFRVFKGIEVDILADGSLDYDDELLAGFDFVIASVHSRFNMPCDEMTARILRAARHPLVTMLGHLTGRLLLARDGYPLDVEAVIDACAESGTVIELNAHPSRLDLDWRFGAYARSRGLKTSINPDAHSLDGLATVRYGVAAARKGGFGSSDVVNTMSLEQVTDWLTQRKAQLAAG